MNHTYPLLHGRGIAYLLVPSLIKAPRSAPCACESRLEQAQGGENTSNSVLCKPHIISYSYVPPREGATSQPPITSGGGLTTHSCKGGREEAIMLALGWLSGVSPAPALCSAGDVAPRAVAGKCLLRGGGLGLKLLCLLLHHLSSPFHAHGKN